MKLNIELVVEIDDTATINEMKAEVIKDVKQWLASAPVMAQLAEAETR
jgi:hypothetical protein